MRANAKANAVKGMLWSVPFTAFAVFTDDQGQRKRLIPVDDLRV
jgi:hypothetical protein